MKRTVPVFAGSVLALALAMVLATSFGTGPVSLARALSDPLSTDHTVVFDVRLPRVVLAAIAGAGLSIVGAALQALLRNPLAEPFVLGVSGGSAVGATVAILIGVSNAALVPFGALLGGLGATALVLAFAASAPGERGMSVLLAGVVVNAIAASVITVLKTLVTPAKAQELLFWLMGFLDVHSGATITTLAVYVALGSGILLYDAGRLNVLSLGADAATHLGVRVRAVEIRTLVASSLVVGAIVSVTGLIGFVGLVVPHVLRRLLGPDARTLLPASLVLGAVMLILCDLVGRASFRVVEREFPVGAVTALVGGPLFLYLLRRRPAT